MAVKAYMVEPAGKLRRRIYIYTLSADAECPKYPKFGHSAHVMLDGIEACEHEENGVAKVVEQRIRLDDDALPWPQNCDHCGAELAQFGEKLHRGASYDEIWRRVDTGEERLLKDMEPGAMWYAPWLDKMFKPQREHVLCAKCPGGGDWTIDGVATNCTRREDDWKQERHHCWVIESGEAPNITVGKNGPTCEAGAGSIQTHNWHGFLRDGWFVE